MYNLSERLLSLHPSVSNHYRTLINIYNMIGHSLDLLFIEDIFKYEGDFYYITAAFDNERYRTSNMPIVLTTDNIIEIDENYIEVCYSDIIDNEHEYLYSTFNLYPTSYGQLSCLVLYKPLESIMNSYSIIDSLISIKPFSEDDIKKVMDYIGIDLS